MTIAKELIIPLFIGILIIMMVIFSSWVIDDWIYDRKMEKAQKACAELNATPYVTYRSGYVCVGSDGRIVR